MSIEYTSKIQGLEKDILINLDCIKEIPGWVIRNRSRREVQLNINDLNNIGMDDAVLSLEDDHIYIAVHRATRGQRDELIKSIKERLTHQIGETISIEEI